jgi:hypothetical protein
MTVNISCQYYARQEIETNEIRNTFDSSASVVIHNCNHPENNPGTVVSKPCSIENDFCPHKP